jgi:hypothetical protein
MAKDAIKLYVESLEDHKEDIPVSDQSIITFVNVNFPRSNFSYTKLPSIKLKDLIKKLERIGFKKDRQSGSHVVMYNL